MSNERHYYHINVSKSQTVFETFIDWSQLSSPQNELQLEFKLYKAVESVWVADECDVGIIHDQTINFIRGEKPIRVTMTKLFSDQYSLMIRGILRGMHVPEEEHQNLIMQVFNGIRIVQSDQMARGVTYMPNVIVNIYDVTLELQNINDDQAFGMEKLD